MKRIHACLRLMRPHHYIKNLLVFAALACSGQLFQPEKLQAALLGFGAFCAASSAVYIINDIRDREKDRLHPTKKNRPIASRAVSPRCAGILAGALLAVAGLCNAWIFRPGASALLALYFALNLAYSFGLKNVPLLDTAILSLGFLLRVAYGAEVTGVVMSDWLYLVVITLAFFFALGKRRNELSRLSPEGETRKVLKFYSPAFLDKNMYLCLALANAFYALWCVDSGTSAHYTVSPSFTVPVVLLITMRYSMDVEGDSDGDPVEVLLHDWPLLALCGAYGAVMFAILYLF